MLLGAKIYNYQDIEWQILKILSPKTDSSSPYKEKEIPKLSTSKIKNYLNSYGEIKYGKRISSKNKPLVVNALKQLQKDDYVERDDNDMYRITKHGLGKISYYNSQLMTFHTIENIVRTLNTLSYYTMMKLIPQYKKTARKAIPILEDQLEYNLSQTKIHYFDLFFFFQSPEYLRDLQDYLEQKNLHSDEIKFVVSNYVRNAKRYKTGFRQWPTAQNKTKIRSSRSKVSQQDQKETLI